MVQNSSEASSSSTKSSSEDWVIRNYDPLTTEAPNVEAELRRLRVLKTFDLLDREREDCYDRFSSLVARMFKAPAALINLVDLGRVWQVSSHGMAISTSTRRESLRSTSIDAHTVLAKDNFLLVSDLSQDTRFQDSPPAKLGFRFYVGTALVADGCNIGTVCILDFQPRSKPFTTRERGQLVELAASVMDLMKEKRANMEQGRRAPSNSFSHEMKRAASALRQQLSQLRDDGEFQTMTNDAQKHVLQSAVASADFLYTSIVRDGGSNDAKHSCAVEQSRSAGKSQQRKKHQTVGEYRSVEIGKFLQSLEMAMEVFPKKAHLVFTVDPEVPNKVYFNDLKVYRSTLALLASACERTKKGFIRLKIYLERETESSKVVVFECEDTGVDVDLERYHELFESPNEEIDLGSEACVNVNHLTGLVDKTDHDQTPVSGGFAVFPVAEYIGSMGGKYGFRPRMIERGSDDPGTGSIFWFSIPLREASSGLDATIDGILRTSLPLSLSSNDGIASREFGRAEPSSFRGLF